ncbi:MAG: hypothetical protein WDO19_03950 [Bacteroidota bacterium]
MNSFILPVTIESRKIVFLDLNLYAAADQISEDPGEDIYITEISQQPRHVLFSIDKRRIIQSLFAEQKDIAVKSLKMIAGYDPAKNTLTFTLSEKAAQSDAPEAELATGLKLFFEEDNEEFNVCLRRLSEFRTYKNDQITVRFILLLEKENMYSAVSRFYIVEGQKIRFAGLDFGSEASQMKESVFDSIHQNYKLDGVNLFRAIKVHVLKDKADEMPDRSFVQFEENPHLYKSVFYAKREMEAEFIVGQKGDLDTHFPVTLDVMTENGSVSPLFFDNWVQVPNLKIIHGSPDFAKELNFVVKTDAGKRTSDFGKLKGKIYAGLLSNMITAYLEDNIKTDVYLRFTLLVPNIYTIQEIVNARKIVREIIQGASIGGNGDLVKAVEISTLSESDASFLGGVSHMKSDLTKGSFYIVIDCGRGTTDFSVIQVDKKDNSIIKPVYRSGFAGAGNLISFAFINSVLHYMMNSISDHSFKTNLEKFLKAQMGQGPVTPFRNYLYQRVEKWKADYSPSLQKEAVEDDWRAAQTGSVKWENLFNAEPQRTDVQAFLNKIDAVYDWGGYIEKTVSQIAGKICTDIELAVSHLKSSSRCGGVLFTGRGFLFEPLKDVLYNRLRGIKGMADLELLNNPDIDPKQVCMQGVFERRIISYSDTASTPIEVDRRTNRRLKKNFISTDSWNEFLNSFIGVADRLTFNFDNYEYTEDANYLVVKNTNLLNAFFVAGGKLLHPSERPSKKVAKARLLQCRKGIFLRVIYAGGHTAIMRVDEVVTGVARSEFDKNNVQKSLFPGWLQPSLLGL